MKEDNNYTGAKVLSFFIPLVGLIIYAVNIGKNNKLAKNCGKWALIGISIPIAMYLIFLVISTYVGVKNVYNADTLISDYIVVPDVTDYELNEAIQILENAGFTVDTESIDIFSNDIIAGNVVKTNPEAGSERLENYTVTMYVSTGIGTITIEDYIGKDATEIKEMLTYLGVETIIEEIEVDDSTIYIENEIIGQSIEVGTIINTNDLITLYTAKMFVYPDFINENYSIDEINKFASNYNLSLTIEYVENEDYQSGTIIYQSKTAGSTIISGSILKIQVVK